jgi:hypothetical protein
MGPLNRSRTVTKEEVANILEDFLENRGTPFAWDDFTLGMSFDNKRLEEIRTRCAGLSAEYPPDHPNEYCNDQGRKVIRAYVRELRNPE